MTTNETSCIYKIYHQVRKLYSLGGKWTYFSKYGKCWHTTTALKSHLTQVRKHRKKFNLKNDYDDCIIVKYSIAIELEVPVEEFHVSY